MLSFLISMAAFVLFISILGIAFILKNKKDKVSCSGGCSACSNKSTESTC